MFSKHSDSTELLDWVLAAPEEVQRSLDLLHHVFPLPAADAEQRRAGDPEPQRTAAGTRVRGQNSGGSAARRNRDRR